MSCVNLRRQAFATRAKPAPVELTQAEPQSLLEACRRPKQNSQAETNEPITASNALSQPSSAP